MTVNFSLGGLLLVIGILGVVALAFILQDGNVIAWAFAIVMGFTILGVFVSLIFPQVLEVKQ